MKRTPPTAVLVALLVLVVGAFGVVYAAWTTQVTINTNVTTGTLKVVWIPGTGPPFDPDRPSCDKLGTDPNDYATVTIARNGADDTQMDFAVTNAFAGLQVRCTIRMVNQGTLPAQLDSATIAPGLNLSGCTASTSGGIKIQDCAQMQIRYTWNLTATSTIILSPSDGFTQTFFVEVKDAAPIGTPFGFTARTDISQ